MPADRETSVPRLADLNPKLEGTLTAGVLRFDCPLGHGHKFRVPLGAGGWQASGELPGSLSLTPSINGDHIYPSGSQACGWHGFITNGEVR